MQKHISFEAIILLTYLPFTFNVAMLFIAFFMPLAIWMPNDNLYQRI